MGLLQLGFASTSITLFDSCLSLRLHKIGYPWPCVLRMFLADQDWVMSLRLKFIREPDARYGHDRYFFVCGFSARFLCMLLYTAHWDHHCTLYWEPYAFVTWVGVLEKFGGIWDGLRWTGKGQAGFYDTPCYGLAYKRFTVAVLNL